MVLLISCNEKPASDASSENELSKTSEESKSKPGATYAEISVKEGGKWVGTKYEGGNRFVNISSLKAPDSLTDHSYYIRYEGPGWESDKIAYRLYLDWRNAIDIFGKKTDSLVLHKVGQVGYDSYHEMNDWGMDILKAGKSLGIGSLGRLADGQVLHFKNVDSTKASVENTAAKSAVHINYYGWETKNEKTDISSTLSIKPSERVTKHTFTSSEALNGIVTGIVKFDSIPLIQHNTGNKKWSYIATYGMQSLVPDDLGMVIFYKNDDVLEVKDGEFDHLLVFKPSQEPITYYLAGAWSKEKDGVKNKEEFLEYIDAKLNELNQIE
jgi:hypothetical protein